MGVKVNIHGTHRHLTNGLRVVEIDGNTVGDCLNHLVERFPAMKKELFQNESKLLNVIEIYVNNESAYPEELAKKVTDGDEIHIIRMLAGG